MSEYCVFTAQHCDCPPLLHGASNGTVVKIAFVLALSAVFRRLGVACFGLCLRSCVFGNSRTLIYESCCRGVDNFLVVGGLNVWRAKRAEKF